MHIVIYRDVTISTKPAQKPRRTHLSAALQMVLQLERVEYQTV
jgi:hypothetical protein